jgi:hypothetical protein
MILLHHGPHRTVVGPDWQCHKPTERSVVGVIRTIRHSRSGRADSPKNDAAASTGMCFQQRMFRAQTVLRPPALS